MSEQAKFFLYLIERYAAYKSISANEVLSEWERLSVADMIYDMYEIYHCERLENAFDDIDRIVSERLRCAAAIG